MKTILSKKLIPAVITALFLGLMMLTPNVATAQETTDSITEVEPALTLTSVPQTIQ